MSAEKHRPTPSGPASPNPFRSLVHLALELRKDIPYRYVTENPPTPEEAAATQARLLALAADCRVAARRLGCDWGEQAVDTLVQTAADLYNAPARDRLPHPYALRLDAALPAVSQQADDWEADERAKRRDAPTPEAAGMYLRRVGDVWHLRFQDESGDFPVRGNKFIGWLAKLLAMPGHAWTVAELYGDPEGKLAADASLGGQAAKDTEALQAIQKRIDDIDAITQETGGSEELEDERARLLRQVKRHSAKDRMSAAVTKAYNNFAAQKSQFLKKLKDNMPQLAAHLKASLQSSGTDYTISYRPPDGTPPWVVHAGA
jgi:hypothetical protein